MPRTLVEGATLAVHRRTAGASLEAMGLRVAVTVQYRGSARARARRRGGCGARTDVAGGWGLGFQRAESERQWSGRAAQLVMSCIVRL